MIVSEWLAYILLPVPFVSLMVDIEAQSTMNGTSVRGDEVEFRVWAPAAKKIELVLRRQSLSSGEASEPERIQMRRLGSADFGLPDLSELTDMDTWAATGVHARAGDRYAYVLDDSKPLPDPVSRLLPEGVHGFSEIVDPTTFRWSDLHWHGRDFREFVMYEIHIGAFTPEGTFDAAMAHLPYLKDLGVSAVEIMPVNAFPGEHNWGYDGVGLYAVQANYGGPEAFKRFVDAAHNAGLAVVLDVVYNHLGNEGNYLRSFGPYFTSKHHTPWGEAVNYDDEGCEGVRRFVVDNALYWLREYHLDGLRLDAVHTIQDDSEQHIVGEFQQRAAEFEKESGRKISIMAETDENDPRYVRSTENQGYGLAAIWSDDFHHTMHAFLTGENKGYYQDFGGKEQIAKALNEGFVFQGEHFSYWKGVRGKSPAGMPLESHIVCLQNHDQVGNRALGERLSAITPRGARFLASAILLLAPQTPLLFMGEEYDEPAPFQFFTDFKDPVIQKAVSVGRQEEFAAFDWLDVPDPQDRATFERSRLTWSQAKESLEMLVWYRELLRLRREHIMHGERTCHAEWISDKTLRMQIPAANPEVIVLAKIQGDDDIPVPEGVREVLTHSEDGFAVRVFVTRSY